MQRRASGGDGSRRELVILRWCAGAVGYLGARGLMGSWSDGRVTECSGARGIDQQRPTAPCSLKGRAIPRARDPAYPGALIPAWPCGRVSAFPRFRVTACPRDRVPACPPARVPAYLPSHVAPWPVAAFPRFRDPAFLRSHLPAWPRFRVDVCPVRLPVCESPEPGTLSVDCPTTRTHGSPSPRLPVRPVPRFPGSPVPPVPRFPGRPRPRFPRCPFLRVARSSGPPSPRLPDRPSHRAPRSPSRWAPWLSVPELTSSLADNVLCGCGCVSRCWSGSATIRRQVPAPGRAASLPELSDLVDARAALAASPRFDRVGFRQPHCRRVTVVPPEQHEMPLARGPSRRIDETRGADLESAVPHCPRTRRPTGSDVVLPRSDHVSEVDADRSQYLGVAQIDDPLRLDLHRDDVEPLCSRPSVREHRSVDPGDRRTQVKRGLVCRRVAAG